MKRLLTLLAILGCFAFGAPSIALAAPACTPYSGGNDTQNWPNGVYFQVCGSDVNANSSSFVAAAFSRIPNPSTSGTAGAALKNAMIDLYAHGAIVDIGTPPVPTRLGIGRYGVVYMFHTYQEWKNFTIGEELKADPGPTAGAITVKTGDGQALYTAIWEVNGVGIDNGWKGGKNILSQEIGHEFGHWVDFLLSAQANGSHLLSNSSQFKAVWNKDGTNLNLSTVKMCGPLGAHPLAYGKADGRSTKKAGLPPYFICDGIDDFGKPLTGAASNGIGPNLNTGYAATPTPSNYTVLQKAWPYFYKPGVADPVNQYAEIFAEEFGATFLGGDSARTPVEVDTYLANGNQTPQSFACSYWWINYVATNGKLPTATSNYYPRDNSGKQTNGCPF